MAYNKAFIANIMKLKREGRSTLSLSKEFGVSRGTLVKWLKDKRYTEDEEINRFLNRVKQIEQEANDELLELVKSTQYSEITKNAMALLTPDNLQKEFTDRGIAKLITLIGNSFDKTFAYERLQLDKRRMDIQERELELKEKELEARMENPDAFATVQIINDAPIKETTYGAN
jgi:transposase